MPPDPSLSFSFSQDNGIVLSGSDLICGPGATMLGLREARRRAGRALSVTRVDADDFARRLAAAFRDRGGEGAEEDRQLVFDVEGAEALGNMRTRDLLEDASEAPVIELVNQLLRRTVRAGASDLHVEPHETGLRARMRLDGTLQTVLDRADVPVARVISRLKVMAQLDISENRLPQDGRIALRLGGQAIDVRVSTMPGKYGERVVLRVLDRSAGLRSLDDLGLTAAQEVQLARMAAMPNGIILSTGPTGSGKTTTLYSLLQLADREERNIVTVEDPIEYDLPGISQSQINAEVGMTFAAGLSATLRQDPDVIMVGEIRDAETARTAAQAALTGHLVFSTLHANSTAATMVRLRDLGLDDFLIASTLRGVVAQRLVRLLCRSCGGTVAPDAAARAVFTDHGIEVPPTVGQAAGCPDCGGSGYAGRAGVFEIVEVDDTLRDAISEGASERQLRDIAAPSSGTLLAQGLRMAAAGATSLDEVLRVLGDGR